MNNKIYVLVATQPNNLGDLVINRSLIKELMKYGEVYIDAYGLPDSFRKHLFFDRKIIDANSFFGCTLKRLSAFKGLRKIIQAGITHYFVSPGPTKVRLTKNFIASLFINLVLKTFKIKRYAVGKDYQVNNKLLWFIYQKSLTEIFIRSKSMDMIKRGGKLRYIPDLAFLDYRNELFVKSEKIGISLRNVFTEKIEYLQILSSIIDYFEKRNYSIVFFFQSAEDYEFNKVLFNYFRSKNNNISFREKIVWYEDLNFYTDLNFVLSNRLHVLLLGLTYSALPFAILNENILTNKIYNIFSSINMNEYLLYIQKDFDEALLTRLLNNKNLILSDTVSLTKSQCIETINSIFI